MKMHVGRLLIVDSVIYCRRHQVVFMWKDVFLSTISWNGVYIVAVLPVSSSWNHCLEQGYLGSCVEKEVAGAEMCLACSERLYSLFQIRSHWKLSVKRLHHWNVVKLHDYSQTCGPLAAISVHTRAFCIMVVGMRTSSDFLSWEVFMFLTL